MKILVISDTHGKDSDLERVLEEVGEIDLFIHCGDVEGSEDYIRALVDCPTYMVSGNNDFFSNLKREENFFIGKHKVLLTHGNYYYVTMDLRHIKEEAITRGYDLVIFGHTHRPVIDQSEKVTVINPGSLSYPRQPGRKSSYIVVNMDEKGQLNYEICYLK